MKNCLSKTNILTLIACIACLLVGCDDQQFAKTHHVGDVYEVVGNLCILDQQLLDEERETVESWQRHAQKFNKPFEKLPIGTKIKIASIEKVTRSSWNTGRYSLYVVLVNVLSPGHDGQHFDASHLIYGGYQASSAKNPTIKTNLVALKIVSTAPAK
jgi:hypothetical protein